MDVKRIVTFFAVVIISLGIIGWSSPSLVDNIKLGLDLKGGFEILYKAEPINEGSKLTRDDLRQGARSLEKRANALGGVGEPEVWPEGSDRIRVRIAGVADQEQLREVLKKPAELTFRDKDGNVKLTGSDFVEGAAKVEFDQTNQPIIAIKVKEPEKLRQVSQELLGQILAIYLDEMLISAPEVKAVLTDGNATISGSYDYNGAKELADIINLGALPLKLEEVYTQSVGATLGMESLEKTVLASLFGAIAILLFMLIYYRLPGVIAVITLIMYSWLTLLIFHWIKATLTLPGIAAFVLGIGMAVDANIITYERIKEEIRSGKSIYSSLRAGSKNSLRTILDANITTIIAAVVLYYIGTGSVQGFALILILSILTSMLVSVLIARILLHLLVRGSGVKNPAYFGVKEADIREL